MRNHSDSKENCDGHDLRMMLTAATEVLERNFESVNALNVFPVPDGDTGTNMLLTMRAIVEEAERRKSRSAGVLAAAVAKAALLGARGNSGVILSQFFKGFAESLKGKDKFDGAVFASALQEATKFAYRGVGKPVEGTILTVIREAAQASSQKASTGGNVADVCLAARDACRVSVARTPTLLKVLKEAGVVDAGGQGFCFVVEGFLAYLTGEDATTLKLEVEKPFGVEQVERGTIRQEFLVETEEEIYGYCTQFVIKGQDLDPDAIRQKFTSAGRSTVVIGDKETVKVHTHAEDPGTLLSLGGSFGVLTQIKIDNMDEQHQQYVAARRQEVETKELPVAVVAVVSGPGLEALFLNSGAVAVVSGGDTMNPSTEDILKTIESAPSRNVLVLPNNRNIVLAAQQAGKLTKKKTVVVPTETIPQGVSALLAFNPEMSLDDNMGRMEKARTLVRTGQVTTAVRSVMMNGTSVQAGQIIGMLERDLVAVGSTAHEVLRELLNRAKLKGDELITLYWGNGLDEQHGREAVEEINKAFPGVDVEVVYGGQPYYQYIVSIE